MNLYESIKSNLNESAANIQTDSNGTILFRVDALKDDKKENLLLNATREEVDYFLEDLYTGKIPVSIRNNLKDKGFTLEDVEVNKVEE